MYDARDDILAFFLQSTYDDDIDSFHYVTATDGTETVNFRICKKEDADDINFENRGLIVLSLSPSFSAPADVEGNIRRDVSYVDCNVYVARTAAFDWSAMIDDIVNEICDTVWSNQNTVTNTYVECTALRDMTGLEKSPVERRLIEIRAEKTHKRT